jgi:hypothetical protein
MSNNIQETPSSPTTKQDKTQPEMSLHELSLSGKPFTRNGVRFGPMRNPGPISWSLGGGSEQKSEEALPYRNQEAMEACMEAHPTLTEEGFKEAAEAAGF